MGISLGMLALLGIAGYGIWKLTRTAEQPLETCEGLTVALYVDGKLAHTVLEMCVGEHSVEVGVTNCTGDNVSLEYVAVNGIGSIASAVTVPSGQRESFFALFVVSQPIEVLDMDVVLKPSGGEPWTYPGPLTTIVECY